MLETDQSSEGVQSNVFALQKVQARSEPSVKCLALWQITDARGCKVALHFRRTQHVEQSAPRVLVVALVPFENEQSLRSQHTMQRSHRWLQRFSRHNVPSSTSIEIVNRVNAWASESLQDRGLRVRPEAIENALSPFKMTRSIEEGSR